MSKWSPDSWKNSVACQLPQYANTTHLAAVEQQLQAHPPLVFNDEIRALTSDLARVADGRAFLLQGGDCAETFSAFTAYHTQSLFTLMAQMSVALTFGTGLPVIRVGRLAGQFAKPRSAVIETKDDCTLPVYKGDIINGIAFNSEARQPDPERMIKAYQQAASTLNQVRAMTRSEFASLETAHKQNLDYIASAPELSIYNAAAMQMNESFSFMKACGYQAHLVSGNRIPLYTSHEALLLPYEQALTRQEEATGNWYNNSGHMLWIGDRTRQLDGAHIEFARGINNPIGIKAGPTLANDELLRLIERLNPENKPGKVNIITRMGADKVEAHLPGLIKAVNQSGYKVIWSCDPMHGNTFTSSSGYKTRDLNHVLTELRHFFAIHHAEGSHGGGIHLEMTGEQVTECIGGYKGLTEEQLQRNYTTLCDPRLNGEQALELAFAMIDVFRDLKQKASGYCSAA
ncbi:3-deoxy-7-phosphoheptulonate synthase class II [Endozoicomonas sp. Mp262]|uniref:class II 3-deoxy-7-phosphoheptulonate synthase n=1 Tax=Endozoicomonas sp. Mp262 TaxID=2919499 RepID=UPI0021DB59DE